jgi:hypothetical protein
VTCKQCDCDVTMCDTRSGKKIMMDAEPVAGGKYVILGIIARVATAEDDRLRRPRYHCHWDTCSGRSSK